MLGRIIFQTPILAITKARWKGMTTIAATEKNFCTLQNDHIEMREQQERTNVCSALLGLDIGTTNISGIVIDAERNTILEAHVIPNASRLPSENDFCEYDVQWIADKCREITDDMIKAYPNMKSIGITGQMHGMLYLNEKGEAVSPLYNWQDGRGNRAFSQDTTYCGEIFRRTGYVCAGGYAFATIFYNRTNHLQPEDAKSFCTIMDYIVMMLTRNEKPLIHPTNAASFGLYDLKKNKFDENAVEKLGISTDFLPEIVSETDTAGYYRNIPVCAAIGDNQASFFGSVKQEASTALVNYGTGSQISVVVDDLRNMNEQLEIRPYLFGRYLLCGSALCGGKAYAVLENFFSVYAASLGESGSQYEIMNRLAGEGYDKGQPLSVSTLFCGTRKDPALRGSIEGIDDRNFTPANLILGVLQGMVKELKDYFDCMNIRTVTQLAASGNAIKKNPVLKMLLEDIFGFKVRLTSSNEEAAIGAALYAGISNDIIKTEQLEAIITYGENDYDE